MEDSVIVDYRLRSSTLRGRNVTTSPETPIVCIVEPEAATRESLASLIRSAGCEARTVASAEEFLQHPRSATVGCLLMEIDLPGLSGLDLQKLLRDDGLDQAELPIIFMSSNPGVQAVVQAMKAGALEFLPKPLADDALLNAIRNAVERSHAALQQWVQVRALQKRYESLSPREREVMNLVVTGRLNKQVGGELGIAEITVKIHRGNLMRKMQAGSLAELVTMADNLRRGARARAADLTMHSAPAASARQLDAAEM
jgi:FixJ family two-component response regulator